MYSLPFVRKSDECPGLLSPDERAEASFRLRVSSPLMGEDYGEGDE